MRGDQTLSSRRCRWKLGSSHGRVRGGRLGRGQEEAARLRGQSRKGGQSPPRRDWGADTGTEALWVPRDSPESTAVPPPCPRGPPSPGRIFSGSVSLPALQLQFLAPLGKVGCGAAAPESARVHLGATRLPNRWALSTQPPELGPALPPTLGSPFTPTLHFCALVPRSACRPVSPTLLWKVCSRHPKVRQASPQHSGPRVLSAAPQSSPQAGQS